LDTAASTGDQHIELGNGAVNTFQLKRVPKNMTVSMQLLDEHPEICAGNGATSVYGSLMGNSQRANGLPR
jgi:hypothetical protein